MSAEVALPGVALRADGITAGYGGDPVIRGITVAADPGEVISLVGPNGSGKSTLLKSLVGVVRVTAGQVRVGDREVTNLPPEEVARAGVGYVPQVDDVFGPLTVRENLEMGGYLLPHKEIPGHIERVLGVFPRLSGMLSRSAGRLIRGLATSGASVLIVEQRARAVLAISERAYVLGGGEVRLAGTPAELSASPDFVESFLGGHRSHQVPSTE